LAEKNAVENVASADSVAAEPPLSSEIPVVPRNNVIAAAPVVDESCALSYGGLRRFLGLVLGLLALYYITRQIGSVLVMFTVVTLTAIVLNPLVVMLERRGVKRGLAVLLVILSLVGILVMVGFLVVPPILQEVNHLASQLPEYSKSITQRASQLAERYPALENYIPEIDRFQQSINLRPEQIGTWVGRGLLFAQGLVGAVFTTVIGLLLLVFMLSDPKPLLVGFLGAVPARHREATGRSLARIQQQMTAWAKATLINGVITGLSTGILLHLIGVRPALVFGVLAFFGEFVPNIGPVVTSIPALFVALGTGPTTFAAALGVILFVQQVESNLLVPFIMGRSMQLHPVTIVFFALAMGALLGAVGAILAVPLAAIAKILFDEFYARPQQIPLDEIEQRAEELVVGKPWPGQELSA
jgi:putative permease